MYADTNDVTFAAEHGRDAGKHFQITEVPPVELATLIMRFVSALRVDSIDDFLTVVNPDVEDANAASMSGVLRLLAGADALATRPLMLDILKYVRIAPDPAHPGVFRSLRDDDLRELKTLTDVLGAFVRANVVSGM